MEIKPINYKEIRQLLNLNINKNFEDNSLLFLPNLMAKEKHFVAIEGSQILGIFSYSEESPMGSVTVDGQEYLLSKKTNFLHFIEVIPGARNRGIGKALAEEIFKICKETESSIRISNIVLEGEKLVNTYIKLSNKYEVDLFFYETHRFKPQIFNASPIKKPTMIQHFLEMVQKKSKKFKV